jgi:hypothetical protein
MKLLRYLSCCLVALLCFTIESPRATAKSQTHVYLLRGLFNVSVGLDALAGKLNQRGIAASLYGSDSSSEIDSVAQVIIRDFRSGMARSIVLIGHSGGAGAAILITQQLEDAKVPVALLIMLDPVADYVVPRNVKRAVNFYVGGARVLGATNVNVDGPGMNHLSIQTNETIHRKIIDYIR